MPRRKGATSGKASPRPNWIVNKKQKSSIEKAEHQALLWKLCGQSKYSSPPFYPLHTFCFICRWYNRIHIQIQTQLETNSSPPLNPLLTSYIWYICKHESFHIYKKISTVDIKLFQALWVCFHFWSFPSRIAAFCEQTNHFYWIMWCHLNLVYRNHWS